MSDFEQCNCNTGEWQGQLCDKCNGTGQAAKQSMQGEAVAKIVYDRKTDENGNTYHKSRPQVWPLISSDELLAYPHSTQLFTHAPDSAARIAEQDAEIARLKSELEEARKDAERWEAICNLWFLCSELKLIQNEDGGYSICEMEFVDNLLVSDFCGDTPEQAIDAALRKIGVGE